MKKIKIKFVGFWNDFNSKNNFIVNILKKYYIIEFSEYPDYLISSCFTEDYLKYNCVRIFYTGENLCPDFNAFDYAIGFEHLSFGDRYVRYPNYCIPEIYNNDYMLMLNKHKISDEEFREKKEFCSFVVSKGDKYVDKKREEFFFELSKYKKVNSGGRYLNNVGTPNGVDNKLQFQKKHKFSIAFENTSHFGYTTEKIIQAFAAQTIPIYWGDPNIEEEFNPASFINCNKYKSIDEIVNIIRAIDQTDAYMSILKQPALNLSSGCEIEKYSYNLEKFLINIFEQNFVDSFRRDRVGYGKQVCDQKLVDKKIRESKKIKLIMKFFK